MLPRIQSANTAVSFSDGFPSAALWQSCVPCVAVILRSRGPLCAAASIASAQALFSPANGRATPAPHGEASASVHQRSRKMEKTGKYTVDKKQPPCYNSGRHCLPNIGYSSAQYPGNISREKIQNLFYPGANNAGPRDLPRVRFDE